MAEETNIPEKNIVIQGVTEDKITVLVDGKTQEIEKKLDVLQALMEQMAAKSVQTAGNIYNIGSITNANFGFIAGQAGKEKSLPAELAENLVGEGNNWTQSLRQELVKQPALEYFSELRLAGGDLFAKNGYRSRPGKKPAAPLFYGRSLAGILTLSLLYSNGTGAAT
jgi:hypothetical protein